MYAICTCHVLHVLVVFWRSSLQFICLECHYDVITSVDFCISDMCCAAAKILSPQHVLELGIHVIFVITFFVCRLCSYTSSARRC